MIQLATSVRNFLLSEYDSSNLQSFCHECSKELAEELKKNGFTPYLVRGELVIDNPDESFYEDWDVTDFGNEDEMENAKHQVLHYWLEVDGLIVDLTADQFNNEMEGDEMPPVVVGTYDEWPRYIKKDQKQL